MFLLLLTSAFFAASIMLVVRKIAPPLPSLSQRISPYYLVSKVRLDHATHLTSKTVKKSALIEIFSPVTKRVSNTIFNVLVRKSEQALSLQLKQAGIDANVAEYKAKLIKKFLLGCSAGLILGISLGNIVWSIFFTFIGGFIAYTKTHARVEKLIVQRRETIRLELSTVNQLIAIYIRTGSGVTQSITYLTKRTNGIVSKDLSQVLARTSSGIPIDESLMIAVKTTPEPHAQRTYKLLASASNRGVDLAQGLLDLAQDLRRSMREDIKATGARRRAAMLMPTIGILAPIMLLFVAAPIPSIVLIG